MMPVTHFSEWMHISSYAWVGFLLTYITARARKRPAGQRWSTFKQGCEYAVVFTGFLALYGVLVGAEVYFAYRAVEAGQAGDWLMLPGMILFGYVVYNGSHLLIDVWKTGLSNPSFEGSEGGAA